MVGPAAGLFTCDGGAPQAHLNLRGEISSFSPFLRVSLRLCVSAVNVVFLIYALRILRVPEAEALAGDAQGEQRQGQHAAPAPGLLIKAVEPFEADFAQQRRREGHPPGEIIEDAAHAHRQAHGGQPPAVLLDPEILLRRTEGDEKYVGVRRADARCDLVGFVVRRAARIAAGDVTTIEDGASIDEARQAWDEMRAALASGER